MDKQNKNTRSKILKESLKLFANNGFHGVSTREISEKADVNISAIKYYFNDKEGLYRAAYREPIGSIKEKISLFHNQPSLEQALHGVFNGMFDLLKGSEEVRDCMRIHMRELVDPTSIWEEHLNSEIIPYHKALLYVIKKEIPNIPDIEAHRIIFSIKGMTLLLFLFDRVIEKICAELINSHEALDVWRNKIVQYSIAIINVEKVNYVK